MSIGQEFLMSRDHYVYIIRIVACAQSVYFFIFNNILLSNGINTQVIRFHGKIQISYPTL